MWRIVSLILVVCSVAASARAERAHVTTLLAKRYKTKDIKLLSELHYRGKYRWVGAFRINKSNRVYIWANAKGKKNYQTSSIWTRYANIRVWLDDKKFPGYLAVNVRSDEPHPRYNARAKRMPRAFREPPRVASQVVLLSLDKNSDSLITAFASKSTPMEGQTIVSVDKKWLTLRVQPELPPHRARCLRPEAYTEKYRKNKGRFALACSDSPTPLPKTKSCTKIKVRRGCS